SDTAGEPSSPRAARRERGWQQVVLALGCAAAYGVFLVLPYYVNNLDAFPLEDVAAGYHDPKDLWPLNTTLDGIVFGVGGLMTVLFGPAVTLGALSWALAELWRDRAAEWRFRGMSLVAVVVALGTLVWLVLPFGAALMKWRLD
ncbi:MAG TPA: hypothetical protein VLA89_17260, partial [Gemmatimonadales bacterium]|nr:hypothetical protein [Gemmatimonadales bacterium]